MAQRLVCCFMWLLLVCPAAMAQTTGDVEGKITDISGGPLPGVTIEATSSKMQGVRVEVSGRDGLYRVLAVPPGKYRIRASLAGFKTIEESVNGCAGCEGDARPENEAHPPGVGDRLGARPR